MYLIFNLLICINLFIYSSGLQLGVILPPRDTRQRLGTFLIVTLGGGGAPGTWWTETREAALHPTGHRRPHI